MDPNVVMWLAAAIVLGIIEGLTYALVSIWIAAGAVAAAIAGVCGLSVTMQWAVFVIVSIIMLAVTRPFVKKIAVKNIPTNSDRIIGELGAVIEKVDPITRTGQIKVMGQIWSAKSENNSVIGEGESVEVVEIVGVRAVVRKI